MLVALGAKLIQADQISHELMRPGRPVYERVVSQFGEGVLNPDGTVNRARLAEAAFGAAGAAGQTVSSRIQELNRIVHPAVITAQEEWMSEMVRANSNAVAIVEAALILESGSAKRFDRLIVVTCTDEQRVARFAARQGLTPEAARKEVSRRMAAQLPEAEKIEAADYVIDNSGSLEQTRDQVQRVWTSLYTQAHSS